MAEQPLSDEDWRIVRRHPEEGARVVARMEAYGPVADIILGHHERWDGKGYPRGLTGEEIPLLARVVMIADAYDVMIARDSYRRPRTSSEAVSELRRVSGTQFDPELVEAFVQLLGDRGLRFQPRRRRRLRGRARLRAPRPQVRPLRARLRIAQIRAKGLSPPVPKRAAMGFKY